MGRLTLNGFFEDLEIIPGQFLIHDDGLRTRIFSYRDVSTLARAFAAELQAEGIAPGEHVILYSENRPEWVIALWGCVLAGVVAVPLDYRSSSDLIDRVAGMVRSRLLLYGDEANPPAGLRSRHIASVIKAPHKNADPHPCSPENTAEIIFTSGATAEPKGVIITHRNILANIVPVEREILKYRKWARPFSPIRFLDLLPLSHMFGQALATFIPPMLPGQVVFMRGFNPSEIVRQVKVRRISVVVCVPKILEILREYIVRRFPAMAWQQDESAHWLLRWWRYRKVHRMFGWKFWAFIVGAAPLAPELEAFWSRLGFLVIQGYGLTETAPIVTLNHPFHARRGSVGKPIAGVEVKIAPDGEILVRGENVASGYFQAPDATSEALEDGWLHTGDIGRMDDEGRLHILGRKKEVIVTPEGLNVFPEDVERVLVRIPGVHDAAVIGRDRVHAVLILEPGADQNEIVRKANSELPEYQRIRNVSIWPYPEFPRTEGTRKLKRHEIAQGARPGSHNAETPFEALTSLERVERMVALGLDESELSVPGPAGNAAGAQEATLMPVSDELFPRWNRSWPARALRRLALPYFLLPLTRIFAHIRVEGLENLRGLDPPVIFAPTHQSYLDEPAILAALPPKWRYRVAPAMSKEFFHEHFHGRSFTNSLNYYLAALLFNAFPIPQREAGALGAMRYMGELANEGWCIMIFPEGRMTDTGDVAPFQPGIGMLAAKLHLPVIPIRLIGLDRVLHRTWKMARPGRVLIRFGAPLHLEGHDYRALAKKVEEAALRLGS